MPEGPEVRRAADEMEQRLKGARLERVEFGIDKLKPHEQSLRGRQLEGIDTFGKASVTNLSGGMHIYSHNMLYGKWILARAGELPGKKGVKLGLHTRDYSLLLYSTNSIDVLTTAQLPEHKYLAKIGPDVLSDKLDVQQVKQLLTSRKFGTKQLGATLLEQAFLAGIGNYLRSEILHAASVHPEHTPAKLTASQLDALADQILKVSRASYHAGGASSEHYLTLPSGESADFDNFVFQAYRRAGEPCPRCSTPIQELDYQKRKVFLCPACQPAP